MGFWVLSAFACLLVLAYFVYSLFILLKEKRLSQMKKDFINNMTHELKTPIANIAVASEVLKNPATQFSAEKMRDYAGLIHRENERLRGQVERVLHIAYLEDNNLDLNREPIDLNDLLQEILDVFSLRVQRRGGALSFVRRATDARVQADRFHLSNVIYGLLDNAEKYSPGRPEITVETENTAGGLRLTVADRGIGIMKSFQNYIFDRFYRAPTGDVHNVKGFGLGLSYAKMIVEAHGGSIFVESEAKAGSRFSIILNPAGRE
jgi:two-component system phosphate regulon sensor histidine kinase PhoR